MVPAGACVKKRVLQSMYNQGHNMQKAVFGMAWRF
jgi:hypothetical protein